MVDDGSAATPSSRIGPERGTRRKRRHLLEGDEGAVDHGPQVQVEGLQDRHLMLHGLEELHQGRLEWRGSGNQTETTKRLEGQTQKCVCVCGGWGSSVHLGGLHGRGQLQPRDTKDPLCVSNCLNQRLLVHLLVKAQQVQQEASRTCAPGSAQEPLSPRSLVRGLRGAARATDQDFPAACPLRLPYWCRAEASWSGWLESSRPWRPAPEGAPPLRPRPPAARPSGTTATVSSSRKE